MAKTITIEAPVLAPATRQTLLDVANVSTDAPAYALQNPLKYEPRIMDGTNRDAPATGVEKVFDVRSTTDVETEVFTAYRGLEEPLLNGPGAANAELEALFEAGEPIFVEEKVQELLLSPAAVDITPTPGTPVTDVKAALGLLEQWMAERYLYQPTVSGNLFAVNLISPGTPYATHTVHGAPIGSAAGFGTDGPGAAVAGAGQAWLYISGQINIWKAPAAEVQNGPDLKANRDYVLVEKSYAASIDGPVAAILIGF